jgi:hypothetical protein
MVLAGRTGLSPDICTQNGITMQEAEIQDYARQLLDAHGDKALAEAAQKARSFEEKGNAEEARTWRRIEAAIKLMRGPHES